MIIPNSFKCTTAVAAVLLSACATLPEGPSVLVLPGTGKNFDQFRADDFECRQFAYGQVGGKTANQAAVESGAASAAVGTALGAAAGALINGAEGAGVGAAAGLLAGALVGTGSASGSSYELQRRYDFAYQQCMYLKGNRVPVAGRFSTSSPVSTAAPPPPPPAGLSPPPPPPPGEPPPPPPDVARPTR